ncbi:uncharacterized protein LOC144406168 [Gasterosteus aculeatus]
MLLLLLLTVFISFLPTFSCLLMGEFRTDVEYFGNSVQDCSKNCSSVHILDGTCKCLNLSKSAENCTSNKYPIDALNDLHHDIRSQEYAEALIHRLGQLPFTNFSMNFCSLPSIISPKTLYEKLKLLGEEVSSSVQ